MSNADLNHIKWIDYAKGLGILLVVLGHMSIPEKLSIIIFSFHMPLFFILSGFLFNEKKYSNDFMTILKVKNATLIWPFITFTIFAIILNLLSNNTGEYVSYDYVLNSIKLSLTGMDSIDTPLWFLTALFSTEIIFSQMLRVFSQNKLLIVSILFLLLIGVLNAYMSHIRVFLNIHISLIALLFFALGWFYKKSHLYVKQFDKNELLLYFISNLVITGVFALMNTKVDMYDNEYGNFFLFLCSSISGSYSVILLSKYILISKHFAIFFEYLGRNSLTILTMHVLFSPFVLNLIGHLPMRLDRLVSLILLFLSIEIINKYMPYMLRLSALYNFGKKND